MKTNRDEKLAWEDGLKHIKEDLSGKDKKDSYNYTSDDSKNESSAADQESNDDDDENEEEVDEEEEEFDLDFD